MRNILIVLVCMACTPASAQDSAAFVVKGDISTYYPVLFQDGGWNSNIATDLQIGRSWVHADAEWRGSMIARFRFHTSNGGNGANFIEADLQDDQNGGVAITNFVGGYQDISLNNGTVYICIWLRGGTTTYMYHTNYAVNPVVYDGVQNALPYNIPGGGTLSSKSKADTYIVTNGQVFGGSMTTYAYINNLGGSTYNSITSGSDLNSNYQIVTGGSATGIWAGKWVINYENLLSTTPQNNPRLTIDSLGNVGIGTMTPQSLLAVAGTVTAKEVSVTATGWPDFVFGAGYPLPSLDSVAAYTQAYGHLPGMPAAAEVERDGLDVGAMQKAQQQKIEELTQYVIAADRRMRGQDSAIAELRAQVAALKATEAPQRQAN